jgi:hypothetical protein
MAKGRVYSGAAHGSEVRPCTCKSDFQDRMYGKGKRLHTVIGKGFRCTVCGKDKNV